MIQRRKKTLKNVRPCQAEIWPLQGRTCPPGSLTCPSHWWDKTRVNSQANTKRLLLSPADGATHKSFLKVPFPSGSKTLKAFRMVSSGSAPADEQLWAEAPKHLFAFNLNLNICICLCSLADGSETLLTFEFLSKHGQKDGEVDGPRSLLQHLIKLLLLHV